MTSASADLSAELPLPCPACGYDLRATTEGRCPECGGAIDAAIRSGEATIPWQQSRGLGGVGRVRGFFATVGWALFHPTRLAQQAGRRVDYRSARWFQAICCLIGAIPMAGILSVDLWRWRNDIVGSAPPFVVNFTAPTPTSWEAAGDVAILVAFWIALLLWLILGSGVVSYFFHRRELPVTLQNRAVALSYYGAAPLVLLAPAAGLVWAALAFSKLLNDAQMESPVMEGLTWAAAGVFVVWCTAATLLLPAMLLSRGLHGSTGRVVALLSTTALAWPLLLALTMFLLPGLVFYVQFFWLLTH